MRYSFRSGSGFNFFELSIEESSIFGGSSQNLALMFQMRGDLTYPYKATGFAIELRELRCKLAADQVGYIATATPAVLNARTTADFRDYKDFIINLEFPIDRPRLDFLERSRKNGDLQIRLDFELLADELVAMGKTTESYPSIIWGLKEHKQVYLQAPVVISRKTWLDRVLTPTGYGKVHIIEFPTVSLEACAALDQSFQALRQAEEHFKLGLYDDAAGKCRLALEPFCEPADKPDGSGKIPKLKKSWETMLGQATYTWLDSSLNAVRWATNPLHHSPTARFGRFETQMLLSVTIAVISYAAREMEAAKGTTSK
jgi:hypothetical protein